MYQAEVTVTSKNWNQYKDTPFSSAHRSPSMNMYASSPDGKTPSGTNPANPALKVRVPPPGTAGGCGSPRITTVVMSPRPGDVSVTVIDPGWEAAMEQEQRNTAQAREVLEEEACHQRKQAGEWEAAAKAQAALVSGLKADVEDERRTQQRLQHDLEALEAERRVERRDRTALAVRLRAAEAAAGAAGDRLTALQGLLSQREADLVRCNAALAESQAARSALEAEERRLAGAIASLGARVDSECDGLRAEVAALKRAAEQRESLVTELTAQGKATRAGARQREEELGRRLAALEAELGQQREACEAATGTLSRLRSILLATATGILSISRSQSTLLRGRQLRVNPDILADQSEVYLGSRLMEKMGLPLTASEESTQPPVDRASMAMPLPECINVVCNNVKGVFWTSSQRLTCQCRDCAGLGEKLGVMPLQLTPTEFERHAGMAASKKWKYTLRVPMEGGEAALLGDWMEARGLAVKAHLRHPRCHMAPPLSSERGSGLLDAPSAAAPRSGGREAGPASTRLTREAAVRRRAEAPETQPEPAQTVAPAPLQPTSAGPAAALADPVVRAASAPLAPGSTLAGAGAGSSYFRPVQGGSLPGPRPHPGSAFNPVGSRLGANPRDPRVLALYRPGTGLAPGEAGEGGPASPASSSGRGRPARADAKPEVAKRARTEASPLAVAAAPGASAPSLAGAWGAQHGPLIAHARGDPRKRGRGRGRGGPLARSTLSPQPREATLGPAHSGPPPQGGGAIAAAQPAGTRDPPRILKWELSPLGQLWLGVRLGDREYTGLLASAAPPPRVKPPTKPRSVPQWAQPQVLPGAPPSPPAGVKPGGVAPVEVIATSHAPAGVRPAGPPLAAPARRLDPAGVPPLAMPLGPRGPDPADIARYWEKHNQGAEAGTLCALCHQAAGPPLESRLVGPGGRSRAGLGPLVLVQPTRKTFAWCHDQCVRWSPEVAEGDPAAIVELAGKAVLRGRGIRCRLCGEKGATLGCMTVCPVSLHLPCAAKGGGLLLVEPYRVACEKHVGAVADFASSDEEEEADGEEGDQRGGRAQDRAGESEGTGTYSKTTSQDTLEDGRGIRPETAAPYQAPRQEAASVRPVTGKKPSLGFKTPYANLSALDTLSIVALNH
ncbi:hypothetical protein ACKKBG_A24905 [Auxenochlorella protothecoides x Auxenochlorella symbiontica]